MSQSPYDRIAALEAQMEAAGAPAPAPLQTAQAPPTHPAIAGLEALRDIRIIGVSLLPGGERIITSIGNFEVGEFDRALLMKVALRSVEDYMTQQFAQLRSSYGIDQLEALERKLAERLGASAGPPGGAPTQAPAESTAPPQPPVPPQTELPLSPPTPEPAGAVAPKPKKEPKPGERRTKSGRRGLQPKPEDDIH